MEQTSCPAKLSKGPLKRHLKAKLKMLFCSHQRNAKLSSTSIQLLSIHFKKIALHGKNTLCYTLGGLKKLLPNNRQPLKWIYMPVFRIKAMLAIAVHRNLELHTPVLLSEDDNSHKKIAIALTKCRYYFHSKIFQRLINC